MTTAPSDRSSASVPRTLADALRARPDETLGALLRARPDLLSPVPGDLTQLATRAGTRASVLRALERLDRFVLQTAEALAVAPDPCPYATLASLLTGTNDTDGADGADGADDPDGALFRAVAELRDRALVWGSDDRLRLVRTARELLTPAPDRPSPTGLGPTFAEAASGMSPGRLQQLLATVGLPATHDPVSAIAALTDLFADQERMGALLDQAPPAASDTLRKLVWGPPYGAVGAASRASLDGGRPSQRPSAPVGWLLDRGLLLPVGPRTVVLSREVALQLRGGRAHRVVEPLPPTLEPVFERGPQTVDQAAACQVYAALATVEELLKLWETTGPPVLRAGGLGVRELKRTADALEVTELTATFWIELVYAAGLLAPDGGDTEHYAPTPAFDHWLRQSPAQQWATLVSAWLPATRTAGLVGTRDAKGRPLTALGRGLDCALAPEIRHRALALLAALPAGGVVSETTLLARLTWEQPRRPAEDLRAQLTIWTLTEAELLGVTGHGAVPSFARALLAPTAPPSAAPAAIGVAPTVVSQAAALLTPLLPEPLDEVLLQADLTAVAPGPLKRPLADTLRAMADIESKGSATVYRFTPASIRRALDSGRSAAELHTFLDAHARTPVPQPLSYLIDDMARKHGQLRVGAAAAYLRCDDDALLAEILADSRTDTLGLRRLAPTVLTAESSPGAVLTQLRDLGYAPAAESTAGEVLIARAPARRAPPSRAPEPALDGPPPPDSAQLSGLVRALRAGDRAMTAGPRPPNTLAARPDRRPGQPPRTSSAETLATVQSAALTGGAVWIGSVDTSGAVSLRMISPVRVEGGVVTAYDHTADEVRTYPLHRITGVAELADG